MRTHRALSDGGYACGYLSPDNGTHAVGQKEALSRNGKKP